MDLFPFDYVDEASIRTKSIYKSLRLEFHNKADRLRIKGLNSHLTEEAMMENYKTLYETYYNKLNQTLAKNNKKKGLIWGIENFRGGYYCLDSSYVYPLTRITFGKYDYPVGNNC